LSLEAFCQTSTIRKEVNLFAEPSNQSSVITRLLPQFSVSVQKRKGIWLEVKAAENIGWVKLTAVRFDNNAEFKTSLVDLKTGREGSGNNVAVTGVRGLDAETLVLATPDYSAFKKFKLIEHSETVIQEFGLIKQRRLVADVAFKLQLDSTQEVSIGKPEKTKLKSKLSSGLDDDF